MAKAMTKQIFKTILIPILGSFVLSVNANAHQPASGRSSLTQLQASHFAALAMKCVQKNFPTSSIT